MAIKGKALIFRQLKLLNFKKIKGRAEIVLFYKGQTQHGIQFILSY